jgi:hypothetical protein
LLDPLPLAAEVVVAHHLEADVVAEALENLVELARADVAVGLADLARHDRLVHPALPSLACGCSHGHRAGP